LGILLKKEQKYFGKKIPVVGDLNQVPTFFLFFSPLLIPGGYLLDIPARYTSGITRIFLNGCPALQKWTV
jgi:hypothetical protein